MKKILVISGVVLIAVAYLGLPRALDALTKWRQYQDELDRRPRFSKIPSPSPAPPQSGLGFFQDIDEVRLLYLRSFHDAIEIRIGRSHMHPNASAKLSATITRSTQVVYQLDKEISDEVFDEVRQYVLRQDVIQHSIAHSEVGADGSTWCLEGRKGNFIIRHQRWSPDDDPEFLAIGKRLLTLAEIKIRDDEFY